MGGGRLRAAHEVIATDADRRLSGQPGLAPPTPLFVSSLKGERDELEKSAHPNPSFLRRNEGR